MNDESRRRLTLYLGEKWEPFMVTEWPYYTEDGCKEYSAFPVEGSEPEVRFVREKHRTFTTYSDLGALKDKLVENGEWDEFEAWAADAWAYAETFMSETFTNWLFRPESCELVDEYLKSKEA